MKRFSVIAAILLITLSGCTVNPVTIVNATESNTSTQMAMSYDRFSGQKEQSFKVEIEPVIVTVSIVTNDGSIDAYIAKDNDTENSSYQGKDVPTSNFTVTLSERGNYTIKVDADNHSGSYSFSWGE